MKGKKRKILIAIIVSMMAILICNMTYAHSGRTDASGGHKDNKNKSGLGSYHYHCGGYPAHLHTNGVCPYSSEARETSTVETSTVSSTESSTSSTESSPNTDVTPVSVEKEKEIPTTIESEMIKINNDLKEMKVGETQQLEASILPENTTDKEITWESSDENVIKVSTTGEITAIGEGQAYITVCTSNKKTDKITILVKEDEKVIDNAEDMENIVSENVTNSVVAVSNTSSEDSNPVGTILSLGALGGIGYLGSKKFKK